MLRIILGCVSLFITGCFGWMLFGKFRQNALMRKLLTDPDGLAKFIQALTLKNIATAGEKLARKGNSYRNNLEDVAAITSHALDITKYQYLLFTVAGIVGGLFIHRYVFWADLAILILVANMRIPRLMADLALKDIQQIIVILYRLRQAEPLEYMKLTGEFPAYRTMGSAIAKVEGLMRAENPGSLSKNFSTGTERKPNPELFESLTDLGRLHYNAGTTDYVSWHSVMIEESESIEKGFGNEFGPMLPDIWMSITGENGSGKGPQKSGRMAEPMPKSFKPDYGLRLLQEGISRTVDQIFPDFRLCTLTVLGRGQYSTMVEMPYSGEIYALSLDFNEAHLDKILLKASHHLRNHIKSQIAADPATPRTIDFDGEIAFGVRARLGEKQKVQKEIFVPMVAQEIIGSLPTGKADGEEGHRAKEFNKDGMPDPNSPVCQLMQVKLECYMVDSNPLQLKALEDSGKLQEYLEERASQARLVYLQCRKAGMSPLQAGEVANQDLYPEPETSEEKEEDLEI